MPYKQRVTGSNPVTPTSKSATYKRFCEWLFYFVVTFVATILKEAIG
jgi:hypothetical protein